MDNRSFTYQTRLDLPPKQAGFVQAFSELYGKVERSLYAECVRGKSLDSCKSSFGRKFGITARHFNAVAAILKGKLSSLKEIQSERLKECRRAVKKSEGQIKRLEKKANKTRTQLFSNHQKKRSLSQKQAKLTRLEADKAAGTLRLCFGSRALFNKQFYLAENGYASHTEWQSAWRAKRKSQFFLIGSKDETCGNQSAQALLNDEGQLDLRVRVPDCLQERYGPFITFKDITFAYGHEVLLSALQENGKRQSLKSKAGQEKFGDLYQSHGIAISYRFLMDEKGCRLFASINRKPQKRISDNKLGAIGVDINIDHLAVAETNESGNLVNSFKVSCCTHGKSQNQARAIIGDACKLIVAYAEERSKPLILEQLDFTKKKQTLKDHSAKRARMLSSFSYGQILGTLKSRAFRRGIEVMQVNPAFTSVIGRIKFAKHYSISIHQAAAFVIARRMSGYSERLPRYLDKVPDNKGGHLTLLGLVKKPGRHVWRSWAVLNGELQTALAAHYQKLARPPSGTSLTSSAV